MSMDLKTEPAGPRAGRPPRPEVPSRARRADDPVNDAARLVAALVCAGSAGIHAGLVSAHLRESALLGILFVVDAAVLGVAAVAISDRRRGGREVVLVATVLAATAIAYLLSRTTGLPILVREAEPVDGLGVFTTLSELVGLGACLLLILRREPR